ncbi:MAG: phosphatase PAP2 family protein [Phycisphaerae bacterium]|nr:phosphatase PAP2 family protein [Phycisphaerae bacterium]
MSLTGGCGTMRSGRKWGQDATLLPGWDRIGRAAKDALTDPKFLVPAAGSAALLLLDRDEDISDWARDHNPIFGSEETAAKWSDDLEWGLTRWLYVTLALTPSGDDSVEWLTCKAKGFGVEWGAVYANTQTTRLIKDLRGRNRPNEANRKSFPSGHTSDAFARATLAMENIEAMDIPRPARVALHHGTLATAVAIGWSRIEAGAHYPSDVLAGAALGTFFGNFVHDAFLGPDEEEIGLVIGPTQGGVNVQLSWAF